MAVLETKRVIQQPKRRRMTKRMRTFQTCARIAVLVSIVFVVGILIYTIGFSKYTSVDLTELTEANLSGYNGHGTLETTTTVMPGYEQFFETVKVEVATDEEATDNGALSNGDVVELSYTYDKKVAKSLGLKIKASDEQVTVKDLPLATVIDQDKLFAGIEIIQEGVAPLITVTMENNTYDEVLQTVVFEMVDPKETYDAGDVVKVRAVIDEQAFSANAYELASGTGLTKEYPITSEDRYITSVDELPDELLEEMKEYGLTLFGTEPGDANEFGLRIFMDAGIMYTTDNKQYTFRFSNPYFISAYFTNIKDEYMGQVGTHVNDVKIVYETNIVQSDGKSTSAEAVVIFRNIIKKADGTVSVDFNDSQLISVSRRDDQIKNLVRSTDDPQYDATKIER